MSIIYTCFKKPFTLNDHIKYWKSKDIKHADMIRENYQSQPNCYGNCLKGRRAVIITTSQEYNRFILREISQDGWYLEEDRKRDDQKLLEEMIEASKKLMDRGINVNIESKSALEYTRED